MIRPFLIVTAISGATMLPGAAQAQFYWGPYGRPPIVDEDYFRRPPGRIPPPYADVEETYNSGEVIGILREEGFRSISRPRRSGNVYVATAVDRTGMRVRVVVGAYEGDIRSVTAIGPEKPAQPRVARTPDPSAIPMPDAAPSANPLNGSGAAGGSAGAPPSAARPEAPRSTGSRPQPNTQAARPAPVEIKPVEPRTPSRVILPNPSEGPNNVPPPTVAPSQALSPPPAIANPPASSTVPAAPQIASPAVPPVPAPEIAAPKPEMAVPAIPAPPPVTAPPAELKAPSAATETLPVPPATSQ